MVNKIFLIGHGIGYTHGAQQSLPTGMTLKFAVPSGWTSTGGISKAYLKGVLNQYAEIITGPTMFSEHYLCGDLPMINSQKLQAFSTGVTNGRHDGSCYIACVRGPSDLALSGIIKFLEGVGLHKPMEIIWTCCRSPINQPSQGKVTFVNDQVIQTAGAGNTAKSPSKPHYNVYDNHVKGVLTVINSTDIRGLPHVQGNYDGIFGDNPTSSQPRFD